MSDYQVEEVIAAWTAPVDQLEANDPEGYRQSMHVTDIMLQLLAEGRPVSVARFAQAAGVSQAEVEEFFADYQESGGEFDEHGDLVGAALTLIPSPHRLLIDGRTLYSWCALDALFIPGLIGTTARIESTCPVSEQAIRLTVTPEGVTEYSPETTVLSITIPGVSCKTERSKNQTGPESDTCSQIHFFHSRSAAEEWLRDHPDVAIFTVAEAWQLAEANWIARRKRRSFQ